MASGGANFPLLDLKIGTINVDLSPYLGAFANVAPNSSVDLAALGIASATLLLNEQTIAADNSSISINAFDLSLSNSEITTKVILGHAQASMTAVPEPSTAALLVIGCVVGLVIRRRLAIFGSTGMDSRLGSERVYWADASAFNGGGLLILQPGGGSDAIL